jgi:hypothetical protein
MSANSTQVAGTHYRSEYQHWDLVADTGMGYFEGQITKYVTRHTSKNGLQDLQKAAHFLQKLIELARDHGWVCRSASPMRSVMRRYCTSNNLGRFEADIVLAVVGWVGVSHLEMTALLLSQLMQEQYRAQTAPPPAVRLLDSDPDGPDYGKAE